MLLLHHPYHPLISLTVIPHSALILIDLLFIPVPSISPHVVAEDFNHAADHEAVTAAIIAIAKHASAITADSKGIS
jgi:hypothetical protein